MSNTNLVIEKQFYGCLINVSDEELASWPLKYSGFKIVSRNTYQTRYNLDCVNVA